MRRLIRLIAACTSKVCLAVLRAIIAGVVFTTCAMVLMHYLGLPVLVPSEVLDKLESLGQLARILS
jgi:cation transporter-like permease